MFLNIHCHENNHDDLRKFRGLNPGKPEIKPSGCPADLYAKKLYRQQNKQIKNVKYPAVIADEIVIDHRQKKHDAGTKQQPHELLTGK